MRMEPSKYTATKSELAAEFKVSLTTVDNWLRRGCPHIEKEGRKLFHPGEVEFWKFIQDRKNNSQAHQKLCDRPIHEVIDLLYEAHGKVSFYLNANHWAHPEHKKATKQLQAIDAAHSALRELFECDPDTAPKWLVY